MNFGRHNSIDSKQWAVIINWLEEKQLKELEACVSADEMNWKQTISVIVLAVKKMSCISIYDQTQTSVGLLTQTVVKD